MDKDLSEPLYRDTSSGTSPGKVYKIALLLPLSGSNKPLGLSMRQAAEMSLFDMADTHLELIPLDTRGTPSGAATAVKEALSKNVDLILGPVFSQNARHIKPLLDGKPVPMVTYSTDLSLAEPGFFVFGFDVIEQIRSIIDYATDKGINTFTAIVPQTQFGVIIEKEFRTLSSMGHVRIENIYKYSSSDRDFSSIASEIKSSGVQALFIPEGSRSLSMILSSLQYHDLDLNEYQLLGTGQWDHPQVFNAPAAYGGWFSNPSMDDRVTFERRYKRTYGSSPHRLASLAYDTLSMAAMLVRLHPRNPFMIASMTQSRGFSGVDGLFRLLPNGDTQRNLAIFQVTKGSAKLLQPASKTF